MKEEKLTKEPQIVKMTSKGQLTLPVEFRRDLKLKRGSYLLMSVLGRKYLLMEKIETSPLDKITEILEEEAKRKGITKKEIAKTIQEVRKERWKRLYEKKV